jgi:hypothetical protein
MAANSDFLKAIHFDHPERIPLHCVVNTACWHHYPPEELHQLLVDHPMLFPGYRGDAPPRIPASGPNAREGVPYTDFWGSVWETPIEGITGCITGHPLADWSALAGYTPPDPAVCDGVFPVDWSARERLAARAREQGRPFGGSLTHGHTFLRLEYLRGYQNLIFDMADDEPRLWQLIEWVEAFNTGIVQRWLDVGASWFGFPEDLGMQVGPMLSPDQFRRFIKPSYQRMMTRVRAAGGAVHMHSDGDIRALLDDLIDGGVECINLQDLVNGVDWIRDRLKGRVCVDLDIDRQEITVNGTPAQIDELIRYEVSTLGSPAGGLMLTYGLYPGTPLANARAVFDAMERYSTYFS